MTASPKRTPPPPVLPAGPVRDASVARLVADIWTVLRYAAHAPAFSDDDDVMEWAIDKLHAGLTLATDDDVAKLDELVSHVEWTTRGRPEFAPVHATALRLMKLAGMQPEP